VERIKAKAIDFVIACIRSEKSRAAVDPRGRYLAWMENVDPPEYVTDRIREIHELWGEDPEVDA
jgi:hypothetical protein